MKKFLWPVLLILVSLFFFWQTFIKGLLPIPSDTIIGLYHPFRDLYSKDYPRGIPFKNFLITDPVRQQYVWKNLSIESLKKGQIPLWNPYSFSGTPHLANFQSGSFYPLNFLFALPFSVGWTFLIMSQPILAGLFTFWYLRNLKLSNEASFLGAVVFSFGGFSIAWLEWGNIVSAGLWLPLILLSIDKIFKEKKTFIWPLILLFSTVASFFAGHLQIFFYTLIASAAYLLFRSFQEGKKLRIPFPFFACFLLFILISAVQWFPFFEFVSRSARGLDQIGILKEGWFIPWQHLIQFVVPDFFGNPATLNYWGVWNYAELVGYIGIVPLTFALFSIRVKEKKVLFFWLLTIISLVFALPNFISKLPYDLGLPLISTSQPTRLLFIITFSLSILSAFGLDHFIKSKEKKSIVPFLEVLAIILLLFAISYFGIYKTDSQNLLVAKRNTMLPFVIAFVSCVLAFSHIIASDKKLKRAIIVGLLAITVFDLFRFGWKFTPFTPKEYLFPETKTTRFLKENIGNYRMMSADPRIFPPNFPAYYKLQSIEGYDPLYLRNYGELIIAIKRDKPDIAPPFDFNRIVAPYDPSDRIIDLMGVKYVLSLEEIDLPKLEKVFEEEQTKVYENKNVLPRAFFVEKLNFVNNKKEAIELLMNESFDPKKEAVVEEKLTQDITTGETEILEYSQNKIRLQTRNEGDGFLLLTDNYYPSWKVKIDNKKSEIYITDFSFRGVFVPKGEHIVEFYATL